MWSRPANTCFSAGAVFLVDPIRSLTYILITLLRRRRTSSPRRTVLARFSYLSIGFEKYSFGNLGYIYICTLVSRQRFSQPIHPLTWDLTNFPNSVERFLTWDGTSQDSSPTKPPATTLSNNSISISAQASICLGKRRYAPVRPHFSSPNFHPQLTRR